MTSPVTLGEAYFDAMYQAAADPWGFEDRWYEQRKYAISAAQLPARRYRRAFQPGCSIGVFTRLLAPRCLALLSCDLAAAAVQAAARRTRDLPQVRVERRDIARQWPSGRFDLVVLSEILYYFGDHDLEQMLDHAVAALEPDGTLLAVHWRHPVAEYPRSGDDVPALAGVPELAPQPVRRHDGVGVGRRQPHRRRTSIRGQPQRFGHPRGPRRAHAASLDGGHPGAAGPGGRDGLVRAGVGHHQQVHRQAERAGRAPQRPQAAAFPRCAPAPRWRPPRSRQACRLRHRLRDALGADVHLGQEIRLGMRDEAGQSGPGRQRPVDVVPGSG